MGRNVLRPYNGGKTSAERVLRYLELGDAGGAGGDWGARADWGTGIRWGAGAGGAVGSLGVAGAEEGGGPPLGPEFIAAGVGGFFGGSGSGIIKGWLGRR